MASGCNSNEIKDFNWGSVYLLYSISTIDLKQQSFIYVIYLKGRYSYRYYVYYYSMQIRLIHYDHRDGAKNLSAFLASHCSPGNRRRKPLQIERSKAHISAVRRQ